MPESQIIHFCSKSPGRHLFGEQNWEPLRRRWHKRFPSDCAQLDKEISKSTSEYKIPDPTAPRIAILMLEGGSTYSCMYALGLVQQLRLTAIESKVIDYHTFVYNCRANSRFPSDLCMLAVGADGNMKPTLLTMALTSAQISYLLVLDDSNSRESPNLEVALQVAKECNVEPIVFKGSQYFDKQRPIVQSLVPPLAIQMPEPVSRKEALKFLCLPPDCSYGTILLGDCRHENISKLLKTYTTRFPDIKWIAIGTYGNTDQLQFLMTKQELVELQIADRVSLVDLISTYESLTFRLAVADIIVIADCPNSPSYFEFYCAAYAHPKAKLLSIEGEDLLIPSIFDPQMFLRRKK